ncbi:cytochrome P450 [Amycolatopsis japonica]
MTSSLGSAEHLLRRLGPIDPVPELVELGRAKPVCPMSAGGGPSAFVVTGHDEVVRVLTDPAFSRAALNMPMTGFEKTGGQLLDLDPPEHTRLRRILNAPFSRERVMALRPALWELADQLLDRLVEHGPPADLIEHVVVPFPLTVICDLVGVPRPEQGHVRELTSRALDLTQPAAAHAAATDLTHYFVELIGERRKAPAEDLITELGRAHDDGQLSQEELITALASLVSLGHETTAAALGRAIVIALRRPELVAELAGPSEGDRLLEDLLRLSPATQFTLPRVTTRAEVLSGVSLPAGTVVVPCLISGNQDPRYFADPQTPSSDARARPHLSFGLGPHYCLGANLAREEIRTVMNAIGRRLPGLRLAVEESALPWDKNSLIEALQRIPVTW